MRMEESSGKRGLGTGALQGLLLPKDLRKCPAILQLRK